MVGEVSVFRNSSYFVQLNANPLTIADLTASVAELTARVSALEPRP
jgi:hypothetical protein